MKLIRVKVLFLIAFMFTLGQLRAQDEVKVMENRAKMLYETIKTSDKRTHETYVWENFSKNLLEKYKMERHTGMLKMLNQDFSDSKIISIKEKGNKLMMVIERNSDKHRVTFDFSFEPADDYKINGLGIEAGEL